MAPDPEEFRLHQRTGVKTYVRVGEEGRVRLTTVGQLEQHLLAIEAVLLKLPVVGQLLSAELKERGLLGE